MLSDRFVPQLVSTILDQAHLSPMTQQVRPISWEHDHALRLYPMPTTVSTLVDLCVSPC